MDINITKLSDKEIAQICIKYNIIQPNELQNHTRDQVVSEIQKWCQYKKQTYRQRRNSSPNLTMPTAVKDTTTKTIHQGSTGLKRSMSQPLNINKTNNPATTPPQATIYNRDRRMSEPFTNQEKVVAREDHQDKKVYHSGQNEVKQVVQQQQQHLLRPYPWMDMA